MVSSLVGLVNSGPSFLSSSKLMLEEDTGCILSSLIKSQAPGCMNCMNTGYRGRIGIVRAACDKYETKVFADQRAVENKAIELYRNNKRAARRYLTGYSRGVALGAIQKAHELTKQFK